MKKTGLSIFQGRFTGKSVAIALIGLVLNAAVLALLYFAFVSFDRSNLIGLDRARADALTYAGITEHEAENVSVQLRFEKLRLYYFVEFESGGELYEYQLAARTGDMVSGGLE